MSSYQQLGPRVHIWRAPSLDKIRGMLYGLALGDALGGPHEVYRSPYVYTGRIEHPIERNLQWQGKKISAIGQVTDDTEMTITLAWSLINNNGYNRDQTILGYETWASQPKTMLGHTTRALFTGVKTVNGYEKRYQKALKGKLKNIPRSTLTEVQSNGSLMRCSPFIVMPNYDAITIDTNLTNPNSINLDVNYLYIATLQQLAHINNDLNQVDQLYQWLQSSAQTAEVQQLFIDMANGVTRDVSGKDQGWVLHAFWCCLLSLRLIVAGYDFKQILDTIILMGGDTDTNGAIAGALLGSYFGYDQLSSNDVTANNIEIMKSVTSEVTANGGWPRAEQYTVSNLDQIAQGLYDLGQLNATIYS